MANAAVHAFIGDRVYPSDPKLVERLSEGTLPLITLSVLGTSTRPCGGIDAVVQITITDRSSGKKPEWEIYRAVELAVRPRLLQQAAETLPILKIRVAAFDDESVDDTAYDSATDTYRLQSKWAVKYVRIP